MLLGDLYGPPEVILGLVGVAVVLFIVAGVLTLVWRGEPGRGDVDPDAEPGDGGDPTGRSPEG